MKPIPDFPKYFADENGNIFSMLPNGNSAKPPSEPRRLRPGKNGQGYLHVILYKDDKEFTRRVAHLVLETFVGPRPGGKEACHNNGIRTDNRLENLRWDTKKNNQADRKIHGTMSNGEKNGLSKLNELQARVIRRCVEFGMTRTLVAGIFKVRQPTISRIVNRERWGHLQ